MKKWTKEFPKKVGWYWFYGYRFKEDIKKELILVKVHKVSNGVIPVAEGGFMYKSETGKGLFCKAILPILPIKRSIIKKLIN